MLGLEISMIWDILGFIMKNDNFKFNFMVSKHYLYVFKVDLDYEINLQL